ncbi:MAG: universal stress protein [bacterium]|nr:universal stress protein [bacterium]
MEKKHAFKFKNVLWATDFSKESRACLPYIKYLSTKMKFKNYALYVLPKFSEWVIETAYLKDDELFKTIEKTRESSLKKLDNISKKAELPFEAGVFEGIASEELINFADENKVDMIFAGRRGLSEIEQILIGSTTSRLIRNSHVPVCVIPKTKKNAKIESILCPIDLSESTMAELRYAIPLAKKLGAKIYVVHVSEFFTYRVPVFKRDLLIEKINEKIVEIADEYNYKVEEIIYEIGEPAQKIIEVAKNKKIDLIPMATHQKSPLEKFFLGSIAEKVLMYSNIPVLIIPPTAQAEDEEA